jgi:hypothetical protein
MSARRANLPLLMMVSALMAIAGHATSQSVPGTTTTNNQTQTAPVTATNEQDIVDNYGLLQVVTNSVGNVFTGGNTDIPADLTSSQVLSGTIFANTVIDGVNTGDSRLSLGTPVYVDSQAFGNSLEHTAINGNLNVVSTQQSTAVSVRADTAITSGNNSIYESGEMKSTSMVNHQAYEITTGRLDSATAQTSSTESRARTSAIIHYSPSPNLLTANAVNNDYTSYSSSGGSQGHSVYQTNTGLTESYASLNGGNMWNAAVSIQATGNLTSLSNAGGSLDATAVQHNFGLVLSQIDHTQYDYGLANSKASAVSNHFSAENNDVTLNVDLNQVSSGGVDANIDYTAAYGYDSYVTSEAVGNNAVAFACSTCQADMNVNSTQVNNSSVTSRATVANTGSGRSIVSSVRAVGNSASYYVTAGN